MRERSIEGAASWTVASFGAMALVSGAVGIVWPEATLALLGCEAKPTRPDGDHTLSFAIASSMAALNMGAYYLLAARANWRAFYRWTVPFRCVTVWVFTIAVLLERAPIGFLGVAAWELVGAIATAVALRWDRRR